MKARRVLVFAGLVAVHLLILALALRPVMSTRSVAPGIAVVEVASSSQPLPSVTPPISELAVEAEVAAPVLVGESGGDCSISEAIGQALAIDRVALDALAAIPAAERSVANATMVWDGSWPAGSNSPVRGAVEAAIRAAAPECRTMPVIGPRLVFVGGVALAFGSGNWTWNDLLK